MENNYSKEIGKKTEQAVTVMAHFRQIGKRERVSQKTKDHQIMCVLVLEAWILRKKDKVKSLTYEMKCFLHIRWQQKISNVEVRKRMETTRIIVETNLNILGIYLSNGRRTNREFVVFGITDGRSRREAMQRMIG